MSVLRAIFSRRWFLATLLVLGGAALCARLGIWQLDRLQQRRLFNARVEAQINLPELEMSGQVLDQPLYNMEYRKVRAIGVYDFSRQIALRNQYYQNEWGVHLVTPLVLEGSKRVILVDRGWIPAQDFESGDWTKFDEPGRVEITGVIRRPQQRAELGFRSNPTPAPGAGPLLAWYFIDIEKIAGQTPYPLLPVYIQQAPEVGWSGPPYRTQPTLDLSEGPHMGYALQWFTFAGLLLAGYPFYIRRAIKKGPKPVRLDHLHGLLPPQA
jgi:surfeit locus 1 family protein